VIGLIGTAMVAPALLAASLGEDGLTEIFLICAAHRKNGNAACASPVSCLLMQKQRRILTYLQRCPSAI